MQVDNAIIKGARITKEKGLSLWLSLDYGGAAQGFGGYLLYAPKGWESHSDLANYAGHFIYRVLTIAGVDTWEEVIGKTIRSRHDDNTIEEIGHILEEDWFNPEKEFESLRKQVKDTVAAKAREYKKTTKKKPAAKKSPAKKKAKKK